MWISAYAERYGGRGGDNAYADCGLRFAGENLGGMEFIISCSAYKYGSELYDKERGEVR